jgi:hypothetical protein
MSDLDEITRKIGERHAAKTKAEAELKQVRGEFFQVATEMVESQPLATMVVTIPDQESPAEYVAKHHPGWRIKSENIRDIYQRPESGKVIIEEDPEYQAFVYINKTDGRKYQRSVVQGQSLLDDETLREKDPDLWEEITVLERVLKPADELFPAYSAKLDPYLVPAPLVLKLPAPVKATTEELNED